MPGSLNIYPHFDAAVGLCVAATATGGSWDTSDSPYSFLLIAWDDPLEEDWHRARFRNFQTGISNTSGFYTTLNNLTVGAGDNDLLTFSWAAPRKRPHHYTLYYQLAAAYDLGAVGIKIRPSTGTTQAGEIPGWATSAIFANSTAVTETRIVAVQSTATNSYYEVEGNHAISLYNGATYIPRPAGGTPTFNANPKLNYSGDQERTRVFETSTAVSQTHIEYNHGPIFIQITDHDPVIQLSLVTGFEPNFREKNVTDYSGRLVERSYLNQSDIDSITIQCTHGGLRVNDSDAYVDLTGPTALAVLHKYRRLGVMLEINYSAASTEKYTGTTYFGTIEAINELGYTAVQANQRIEIVFKVQGMVYESTQQGAFLITEATAVAGSSGPGGSVKITGDKRNLFPAGTRFEISNSTGKDGLYVVGSTALSSGNTVITIGSPNITDGTDDGYLRIWHEPT